MPWKKKPFGWGRAQLGLSMFPKASDATVESLSEVQAFIDSGAPVGHVVFKVETFEPPSVELAIQLMLDRAKSKLSYERIATSVPSPDPRKSRASYPVWKFRFGQSRPALAKPADDIGRLCAEVVRESRDCFDSWDRARERSSDLAVSEVESLLAVMVYPPAIEGEYEPADWLRRVQLAAAQLATFVEMNQEVMIAESRVADVMRGPLDWSIDAALFALAQRAEKETQHADSVYELARKLLTRVPIKGTWSCREVAVGVMSSLGKAPKLQNAKAPSSNSPWPAPPV